jgi:hypothetical protein
VCSIPTFYRVVKTNPPEVTDFFSRVQLGWRLPPDLSPPEARLWEGVSVQDSEEGARAMATRYPRTGQFIAQMEISGGGSVSYEKTRGRGHFTLWGDPAVMIECVVSVVAVRG